MGTEFSGKGKWKPTLQPTSVLQPGSMTQIADIKATGFDPISLPTILSKVGYASQQLVFVVELAQQIKNKQPSGKTAAELSCPCHFVNIN
jgi:hypothetical protein